MSERFGKTELPHIVRRQLQDLRQNPESLEEYAERAQKMASDGYPNTSKEYIPLMATDGFLKGLSDKRAALTAMEKDPTSLDEVVRYVKPP